MSSPYTGDISTAIELKMTYQYIKTLMLYMEIAVTEVWTQIFIIGDIKLKPTFIY